MKKFINLYNLVTDRDSENNVGLSYRLVFLIAFIVISAKLPATNWPKIAPLDKIIQLEDRKHEAFKIYIKDSNGKSIYVLDGRINCWDQDYVGFSFSGAFECRLKPLYEAARHPTLLTDHQHMSTDWQSRGRFLWDELVDVHDQKIPEYGRLRHFRLREMVLTLNVKNLTVSHNNRTDSSQDEDRIQNLELEIIAKPDSTATSDIAEKTLYPCPVPCSH
jgi:hypothetical protein